MTRGEFSLINHLIKRRPKPDSLFRPCLVGPGDDAALLSSVSRPVITTDTQRENVHFRRAWQTPFEIGSRAVQVTLSDLAASFAKPVALFINLGIPQGTPDLILEGIYEGLASVLEPLGCDLGGGNTCRSEELSLDLFAIGEAMGEMPQRGNAQDGEVLCVTGPLGHARAGLYCLQHRLDGFSELIHAFKRPVARFDAAEILFNHGVRCAMDVSDGLAGDAMHMAKASGVTLDVNLASLPLSSPFADWCAKTGEEALQIMASGGEEYQLLFTCLEEHLDAIQSELFGVIPLGKVKSFDREYVKGLPLGSSSYEHM